MKYIPLTQGKVAIVDDEDYEELSKYRWHAQKHRWTYYAQRALRVDGRHTIVIMHRQIMDASRGQGVDHENGDGLDNQKSNLRFATHSQNQGNRKRWPRNTSGRRGVSALPNGRWRAVIKRDGTVFHLGCFDDIDVAARAYDAAAIRLFGEFANPNFPQNGSGLSAALETP